MILGMEIGLAIYGFLALIRGRFTVSSKKVVTGTAAYVLGLLSLCPIPLAFLIALVLVSSGKVDPEGNDKWVLVGVEAGIVIGFAAVIFTIGAMLGTDPAKKKRKKRRYEEAYEVEDDRDENEQDDRPRRKRRREEDELEEDDRPRRKKRDYDDDLDDGDRNEKRRKPWDR